MSSTSSSACVHYVPYVILVEVLQAPQMIEKHIKVKKCQYKLCNYEKITDPYVTHVEILPNVLSYICNFGTLGAIRQALPHV